MDEFLGPTVYCDTMHRSVIAKAHELSAGNLKESAVAIWDFVSDMPYRFDVWGVRASETLAKGYGMCTNKANLQIALLRSLGIPAAYGIMKIKKEAFYSIGGTSFYEKINPQTVHVFCYVNLNGLWIASDATKKRERFWDGETDYKKPPIYTLREEPMVDNLDSKMAIKSKYTKEEIVEINKYIDELEVTGDGGFEA